MYLNTGLPKIFSKKRTGIVDIIVFIIKYCLLLDTSELFVNEKMELNGELNGTLNGTERCEQGFDLVDFFTFDLSDNRQKILFGGSAEGATAEGAAAEEAAAKKAAAKEAEAKKAEEAKKAAAKEDAPSKISAKEQAESREKEEKIMEAQKIKQEANEEFKQKEEEKNTLTKEIEDDIKSKADESISIDTGKTGEESISGDLLKLITDTITEGTVTVSNKVKGFVMIFVYASVYPAVPFFAVMAVMFATLKYFFYKIRIF